MTRIVDKTPCLVYFLINAKGEGENTVKNKIKTMDMSYVAMFVALMAIGANITAIITIGTVPLTMQSFFAIMAGALLGSRLGAVSMLVYLLVGLVGVPVFSHFTGGPGAVFLPTFGFILSFIFVAYVTGKIIESVHNPDFSIFLVASFAGLIMNYIAGTTIMYVAAHTWLDMEAWTYAHTWFIMLPFIPKDIALTIIAAAVCPRVYRSVRKSGYAKV